MENLRLDSQTRKETTVIANEVEHLAKLVESGEKGVKAALLQAVLLGMEISKDLYSPLG